MVYGCSIIEQARSLVVWYFLQSDATHLLWIDRDQTFSPEDAMTLVALATRLKCVAPYPLKRDPPTWLMPSCGRVTMNEYGCIPVNGMGMGFCCIDREILQKLSDKSPRVTFFGYDEPVPHLFRNDVIDGRFRGEDIAFFADVKEAGYQPWLYPEMMVGHIGQKEYKASFADELQKMLV